MRSDEQTEQFELEIIRVDARWRFGDHDDRFLAFLKEHKYFLTYHLLLCGGRPFGDELDVIHFDFSKGWADRTPPLEELIEMAIEKKGEVATPQYHYVDWVWFTLIKYMLEHVSEQQRKMLLDEQHTIDFQGTTFNFILRYGFMDDEPFTRDDLPEDEWHDYMRHYIPRELFNRFEDDPIMSKIKWTARDLLPILDEYNASPHPDFEALVTKIRDFYIEKLGINPQESPTENL